MNIKQGILLVGIALLIFCAFTSIASAKTWYVDDDGGPGIDFTDIQDAINSATAGDTIIENSARYGGGIDFRAHSGGQAINNVLMDNTAIHRGGGISIYPYSSPTITNNIIVDNSRRGIDVYSELSTPLIDFNDIWNNKGGNYGWDASAGANDISVDPLFVNPAIGDYHLQAGSPCIDTGTNVGAPSTDLAGNPRPIDGDGNGVATVDTGAFEYVSEIAAAKVFCPHNIISDNEFTNANAMTKEEIQSFLEKKGSCLATYKVGDKSAAQIIYAECQAKKISPKVMLATIQKETSLLGDRKNKCDDKRGSKFPCPDWTWAESAFGCGFKGGAYCPSEYKGFDNQSRCAANTFRNGYNMNMACKEKELEDGGTIILINRATYALYKYTPVISSNELFYNVYTGWGWDPKGGDYVPGTPEEGCCEYCDGKCYDSNRDPEECRVCYEGTWYPGYRCEEGECIPEIATIAIPVAAIIGLMFLFSRRKRKKEDI